MPGSKEGIPQTVISVGLKEMQPVSLSCQSLQELTDALPALLRFRMGDRHGILCGIPVSQPGPAAYFNEGSKPGKQDIDLRLVQGPDIDHGVHGITGSLDLQCRAFLIPVPACLLIRGIHHTEVTVGEAGFPRLFDSAFSQKKYHANLLSGLQTQVLLQGSAVIAAFFV